jgi:hypothetical protein
VHLVDLMASPLGSDLSGDRCSEIAIARPVAQQRAEIEFPSCKQAMSEHAVGGETNTVAGLTESFGNAGNDAKLAATVDITPARCGIAFALSNWF